MPTVASQFIEVDHRRVFMRAAGKGPAVLLLHQSPQNSRALVPLIERLSPRFAVFAPDTPGFGYSDPLPLAEPEIPDYAAALAALIDRLGLDRVMVYGVHTGAVTALRLALDFPQKVIALVCDGYARFDAREREDLLTNYLPPFEPAWDGGHLTFLFQRMREQNFFFPWNDPRASARLTYPIPATATVHNNVLDVLDAGDGYRVGYRAPFWYDDATAASRLAVDTQIFYRAEDVLAPHQSRLFSLPANVEAFQIVGGAPMLHEKTEVFFSSRARHANDVDAIATLEKSACATRFVSRARLGCRVMPGAGVGVRVHIHDIGHAAQAPVTRDQAKKNILIDLPGHGASRDWREDECRTPAIVDAMSATIAPLAADGCEIHAEGGACAFALMLAKEIGSTCTRLVLRTPVVATENMQAAFLAGLPALTPTANGEYLLAAWNWARTNVIFSPWETDDGGQVAQQTMAPAPRRIHAQVVEMLRAGPVFNALWKLALDVDVFPALAQLSCPIAVTHKRDAESAKRIAAHSRQYGFTESAVGDEVFWSKGK